MPGSGTAREKRKVKKVDVPLCGMALLLLAGGIAECQHQLQAHPSGTLTPLLAWTLATSAAALAVAAGARGLDAARTARTAATIGSGTCALHLIIATFAASRREVSWSHMLTPAGLLLPGWVCLFTRASLNRANWMMRLCCVAVLFALLFLAVKALDLGYLYVASPTWRMDERTLWLAVASAGVAARAATIAAGRVARPVEDRIVQAATFALGAAIVLVSVAMLIEMRRQLERDKGELLAERLEYLATMLRHELVERQRRAMTESTDARLIDALDDGGVSAGRQRGEDKLRSALSSLESSGLNSIEILDAIGKDVISSMHANRPDPIALDLPQQGFQLVWETGLALRSNLPVAADGRTLGFVIAWQPIRVPGQVAGGLPALGDSGELEVCARLGEQYICLPSRLSASGRVTSALHAPTTPAEFASEGMRRVIWADDYRGRRVLAALLPLPEFGLGLVAKVDAVDIMAPVRRVLEDGFPALLMIVGMSHWALGRRLRPLAKNIVTAREEAERHAARWSALNNAAVDGFMMLHPTCPEFGTSDLIATDLNASVKRLLRLSEGTAESSPINRLMPEVTCGPLASACRKAFESGVAQALEVSLPFPTRKLQPRWLRFNIVVFRKSLAVTISDLTLRKRAELESAQAQEWLQQIADNTPAIVAYWDRDLICRFANTAHARILGVSERKLIGQPVLEAFNALLTSPVSVEVHAAMRGNTMKFERQIAGVRPGRFLDISIVPDIGPRGALRGAYVLAVDVSVQRKAQQTAQASQHRLQSITDRMPAMISMINSAHMFEFTNLACEAWFRRPLSEIAGRHLREIIGADAYQRAVGVIARAQATRRSASMEDSSGAYGVGSVSEVTFIPQFDSNNEIVGFCLLGTDVTEARARELRLVEAAHSDPMTGLPNRTAFGIRLDEMIARSNRTGKAFGLAYVDLDYFKSINDTYGHAAGDQLLITFGSRVKNVLRRNDLVARLGGDEFALLLDELDNQEDARIASNHLYEAFAEPMDWKGTPLRISASIGLALLQRGEDAQGLIQRADAAVYEAKAAGRNCCVIANF